MRDEERALVAPYLLLSRIDSSAGSHDLRAILNAVRYIVKGGNQWRLMPHDLPLWPVAYQQMRCWTLAGCFERIVEEVQSLLRQFGGRKRQPTAVCIDSRATCKFLCLGIVCLCPFLDHSCVEHLHKMNAKSALGIRSEISYCPDPGSHLRKPFSQGFLNVRVFGKSVSVS